MVSYDGWEREHKLNSDDYHAMLDDVMSKLCTDSVPRLEQELASFVGRKYAVMCNSATDALTLALVAHGIGDGDEVLVTNFSFVASATSISLAGAKPVFCDVDIDSYHTSINSIQRMISPTTKALIYTHLFGNMVDTTEIERLCDQHNILFIEDAAQSLGSSLHSVRAGSIGKCSAISFNSNKVIAGINGGGALLMDDQQLADRVKSMTNHGLSKSTFAVLGRNSRMYQLNAEVIRYRLRQATQWQQRRQEIAALYDSHLSSVVVPKVGEGLNHNYHKYVIRFDNKSTRDFVKRALNASVHYDTPISLQPMYNTLPHRTDLCLNALKVTDTVLSLPIHAWMEDSEAVEITNAITALI
jgi:dTDP-4-amino-4,6-dideoxygalactose transaminase